MKKITFILSLLILLFGCKKKQNISKTSKSSTEIKYSVSDSDFSYEKINNEGHIWFKIKKNGLYGIADDTKQTLVKPQYTEIKFNSVTKWYECFFPFEGQIILETYDIKGNLAITRTSYVNSIVKRTVRNKNEDVLYYYISKSIEFNGKSYYGVISIDDRQEIVLNASYDDVEYVYDDEWGIGTLIYKINGHTFFNRIILQQNGVFDKPIEPKFKGLYKFCSYDYDLPFDNQEPAAFQGFFEHFNQSNDPNLYFFKDCILLLYNGTIRCYKKINERSFEHIDFCKVYISHEDGDDERILVVNDAYKDYVIWTKHFNETNNTNYAILAYQEDATSLDQEQEKWEKDIQWWKWLKRVCHTYSDDYKYKDDAQQKNNLHNDETSGDKNYNESKHNLNHSNISSQTAYESEPSLNKNQVTKQNIICRVCYRKRGICASCDGTKKVKMRYNSDLGTWTYRPCHACRGSGICPGCGGDGFLDY